MQVTRKYRHGPKLHSTDPSEDRSAPSCSNRTIKWQLQHRYMTLETMTGMTDETAGDTISYMINAA